MHRPGRTTTTARRAARACLTVLVSAVLASGVTGGQATGDTDATGRAAGPLRAAATGSSAALAAAPAARTTTALDQATPGRAPAAVPAEVPAAPSEPVPSEPALPVPAPSEPAPPASDSTAPVLAEPAPTVPAPSGTGPAAPAEQPAPSDLPPVGALPDGTLPEDAFPVDASPVDALPAPEDEPVPAGAQRAIPAPLPDGPRAALLAPGTVRPDSSTTGVPAGTPLRVVQGDLDITVPGTVVDAVDVRGFLRIKAPGVTVTRSVVRGGPAVRVEGVVTVYPAGAGFVIEDSEVYPSQPSVMLDGIKGAGFTARRVHVHGGVDNIKVHGSDVLIESSYLHDQDYYASDPLQKGGPTHNDALQVLGGNHISVVGNTLLSSRDLNAALQVTQDFAPVTRMEVLRNWFDGGGCSVNINHKKLSELRDIALRGNVFGRGTRYGSCGIILTTMTFPTLTGNVYTDGAPVVPKYMAPV